MFNQISKHARIWRTWSSKLYLTTTPDHALLFFPGSSLPPLFHAYQPTANATSSTNVAITSFIVIVVGPRDSQSDIPCFASPKGGICWFK